MLSKLGPVSVAEFIEDYWQKKPLLMRGLIAAPNPGVDANELAGLSLEPNVESRIVYEALDGRPWQVQQGPFSERQLANLPECGWTLLIQGLDHWVPECADLLDQFRFIPNWRVDDIMASYAVKGGSVGPHFDQYDVFLLQTSGQRRWQIGPKCDHRSPRLQDTPLNILQHMNTTEEWIVEPGDCLYLPPGFAHFGVALTECMTLSIGFRAPRFDELISSLADKLCANPLNDHHMQDALLSPQKNSGEISWSTLTNLQQHIAHQVADQTTFAGWFGEFITAPKNDAIVMPLADENRISTGETETLIRDQQMNWRWNEGSRFTYSICDQLPAGELMARPLVFSVDGYSMQLKKGMLEWVQLLCQSNAIDSEQLRALTTECEQKIRILTKLINRGSLVIRFQNSE